MFLGDGPSTTVDRPLAPGDLGGFSPKMHTLLALSQALRGAF